MTYRKYEVKEDYSPEKNYQVHLRNKITTCLSLMRKGDQFQPIEFARKHQTQLTTSSDLYVAKNIVSKTVSIAKKIGLIEQIESKDISFKDFCNLETVLHFKRQLRKSHFKHLDSAKTKTSGTQNAYLYSTHHFHNWLVGREFKCTVSTPISQFNFEIKPQTIKLQGIEHLLELYETRPQNDPDFVRLIKKYLMSDIHKDKKAGTIDGIHSAIVSYFAKNEFPITFDWDPNMLFGDANTDEEDEEAILTLDDLMQILTTGKPSVTEKAVILCKFHRGLDNSTFADRFNYEAWSQLVDHFRTDDYSNWDMSRCPVPIKLTRVKTGYTHRGFLDIDAITSLQKYLDYRRKKKGQPMKNGEPIFLNSQGFPIKDNWIQRVVPKLAERAQIQSVIEHYKLVTRHTKTAHELRDLLKSTLIVSGTIGYVCELAIGHKVGDSYEKQDQLYPDKSRAEYMKASKKLNIFSNISHYMKGDEEKEALRQQVADLKDKLERNQLDHSADMDKIKQDNRKILTWIEREEELRK